MCCLSQQNKMANVRRLFVSYWQRAGESPSAKSDSFLKIKSMLPWNIQIIICTHTKTVCRATVWADWLQWTKNCAIKNYYYLMMCSDVFCTMQTCKHMLDGKPVNNSHTHIHILRRSIAARVWPECELKNWKSAKFSHRTLQFGCCLLKRN